MFSYLYHLRRLEDSSGTSMSSHKYIFSSLTPSSYVGFKPTEEGEKRDKELDQPIKRWSVTQRDKK